MHSSTVCFSVQILRDAAIRMFLILGLMLACVVCSPAVWAGSWVLDHTETTETSFDNCQGSPAQPVTTTFNVTNFVPLKGSNPVHDGHCTLSTLKEIYVSVFIWQGNDSNDAPTTLYADMYSRAYTYCSGQYNSTGFFADADNGLGGRTIKNSYPDGAVADNWLTETSSGQNHYTFFGEKIIECPPSMATTKDGVTSIRLTVTASGSASCTDPNGFCGKRFEFAASVVTTPDFTLSLNDTQMLVPVGGSRQTYAVVTPINGFTGTVSLSEYQGAAKDLQVSFQDMSGHPITSVFLDGTGSVTVIVNIQQDDTTVQTQSFPGVYDPTLPTIIEEVTVIGTSGSLVRSATTEIVLNGICPGTVASPPPYASASAPADGPGDDPINLATGVDTYHQSPDLVAYNPNGLNAGFERTFHSDLALNGYGSPGLSPGWTHGYDTTFRGPVQAGTWGPLTIVYANGARNTLTPVLDSSGQPTGAITSPAGAPYQVQGVPATTAGQWQSFTITWSDQTRWTLTPVAGVYAITQITNRTGQSLNLAWSSTRQLSSIADGSGATLLSLAYDGNGKLSGLIDLYGRKVSYSFATDVATGVSVLSSVSQLAANGATNVPLRATYGYVARRSWPLLTQVTTPSSTGSGTATSTVSYDPNGVVTSFTDPNGNQHAYTYSNGQTRVQVKSGAGKVCATWTQKFDTQARITGTIDGAGHADQIVYGDSVNFYRPTQYTDRNGHSSSATYDAFGNLTGITDARQVTTTLNWDYSAFPLGRLSSVQTGTNQSTPRTPVTIAYFEPSGLVKSVTSAAPGSAAGGGTVTRKFTYDGLGNLLTYTGPGNNATLVNGVDQGITTTFNYTSDAGNPTYGISAYSQAAAVNEPLTITDNLGHITHLRYTSRGQVQSTIDALGHETDMGDNTPSHMGGYNLADQPLLVTLPATGQTGSGRGTYAYTYLCPGGPLMSMTAKDEGGTVIRQISFRYGGAGEKLGVTATDNSQPASYTYDAFYRLKSFADGNSQVTRYYYNAVGELASVLYPGGDTKQFPSYDPNGNVLKCIDGRGVVKTYTYNDPESRLTDITYPGATGLNVHYSYDVYGRTANRTDASAGLFNANGAVTTPGVVYSYDDADFASSVQTTLKSPSGTLLPAKTLNYSYWPNGSRQGLVGPSGSFSYTFDGVGRMNGLSNPFGETASWNYRDNGWLQNVTHSNGLTSVYSFNSLGQLTDLLHQGPGGTTLSDFGNMGYDGIGNRTAMTVTMPGVPGLGGTTNFGYDSKGQLQTEQSTRSGGYTRSFLYDLAGNPTTFRGTTSGFNVNNQNSAFTFDKSGNPVSYQDVPLAFDAENRLLTSGH